MTKSFLLFSKFHSPAIKQAHFISRREVINTHFNFPEKHRYIFIEARGGQGKTVLAGQIAEQIGGQRIWYQIGPEDEDPIFFFSMLVQGILHTIDSFSSPRLTTLIESGMISRMDIDHCVELLVNKLSQTVKSKLTFIFDDLYLASDAGDTHRILSRLMETSPQRFTFILTSRRRIHFPSRTISYSGNLLRLRDTDLSPLPHETKELLRVICKREIDPAMVSQIHTLSHGWLMGIVIAAYRLSHFSGSSEFFPSLFLRDIGLYFQNEIFTHFPWKIRKMFLTLSLLDEIPLELAARVTGQADIEGIIHRFTCKNDLISYLDEEHGYLKLHHLLQHFLASEAQRLLKEDEQKSVHLTAAEYFLANGNLDKGLAYFLRAGDYAMLEDLLYKRGLELFLTHRHTALASLINGIQLDLLEKQGWFLYFKGLVMMERDQKTAMNLFRLSLTGFEDEGNKAGELAALSEILHGAFLFFGGLGLDPALFTRADMLYRDHADTLPRLTRIRSAANIGFATIYILNDWEKGRKYCRAVFNEAQECAYPVLLLSLHLTHGYSHIYQAHKKESFESAEQAYRLTRSLELDSYNRLTLDGLQLTILELFGDHDNYARQKRLLAKKLDPHFFHGSILYYSSILWESALAISQNDLHAAAELLTDRPGCDLFDQVSDLRAMRCACKAFLAALQKNLNHEYHNHLADALHGLSQCVIPYYRIKTGIMIAPALAFSDRGQAIDLLRDTADLSRRYDLPLMEATSLLHLALLETRDDVSYKLLAQGIQIMRQNDYQHILFLTPSMLSSTLKRAYGFDIEKEFIKKIANYRLNLAFLPNGAFIPFLMINICSQFSLNIQDKTLTDIAFTQTQKRFLLLIISNRSLQVSTDYVQTLFWPDIEPQKARNRFDTMMTRLRKTMNEVVKPYPIKHYLSLEDGMVSLKNCRIDLLDFLESARQGIRFVERNEYWRANNYFYKALLLAPSPDLTTTHHDEPIENMFDDFLLHFERVSLHHSHFLMSIGHHEEAAIVARDGLRVNPAGEELVKTLYELALLDDAGLDAGNILKKYTNALQRQAFTSVEIEQALKRITSQPFTDLTLKQRGKRFRTQPFISP